MNRFLRIINAQNVGLVVFSRQMATQKPHFKNMYAKQARIMARLDEEIRDSMEKIVRNTKVRPSKQKKVVKTTSAILNQDKQGATSFFQESVMSSGSPEQLAVRKEGMPKSFLTTRMKVFNANFSRAVAEAFIMDEELSNFVEKFNIQITQVRISSDFKILNIYWTTSSSDSELPQIVEFLNSKKSKLHQLMIDTQYTNSVPWISFIYDLQDAYEREINARLEACKDDLVVESKHRREEDFSDQEPVTRESPAESMKKSISFENPIKEIDLDEYYQRALNSRSTDSYSHLRFSAPEEMELNFANLEYEQVMNKVLQKLKRTREKTQIPAASSTLGIHLPPIDVTQQVIANTEVDYNTEERIKAIKKYIQLNKKRSSKLENKLKRKILQEEIQRFESYESLRDRMEEQMVGHFEDQYSAEFVDSKDP